MSLHTVGRIHHNKEGRQTHIPTISTYPLTLPKLLTRASESGTQGCRNRNMATSGHKLQTNNKVYSLFP